MRQGGDRALGLVRLIASSKLLQTHFFGVCCPWLIRFFWAVRDAPHHGGPVLSDEILQRLAAPQTHYAHLGEKSHQLF
jgi:hypothetical protein